MTSTPDLTRSGQSLRFFGLPLRVPITTTDLVIMPLYWSEFQVLATRFAFTSLVTSGSSANSTTSAGRPAATARLWSPEAPYDWVNVTFFPASVAWNALMICLYAACGVEYATSASWTLSPDPDEPDEPPPHAATESATTAATAAIPMCRTRIARSSTPV